MAKKKCCKGKCSKEKSTDKKPTDNIESVPDPDLMTKTNYFFELIKKNFLP